MNLSILAPTRSDGESGSRRRRRSIPRRTPGIRRRRPLEINDMESFSLLISEPNLDPSVAQRRGQHMAKSHDDTSAGAVHQYQDELGKISPLTFMYILERLLSVKSALLRWRKYVQPDLGW